MGAPCIRQCINIIHFFLGKWHCRRILYHIYFVRIGFHQHLSGKRIGVVILNLKALCIQLFVCFHFFVSRQIDLIIKAVFIAGFKYRSPDISNVGYIHTGCQCIRDLHDGFFPHAIGDQICTAVQQYGTFKGI